MSASDLIRKYFSAYENNDRKAVESLLTGDFVFTSPYDRRIDRETYFKRCWPYSEKSPTYGIEKLFEKATKPLSSTTARPKMAAAPGTRNSSLSKETR
jgi:ketosteroid isomerase-like protein